MKAVRFSEYGGTDVLDVVDIDIPMPAQGEVLVQVVAAGINPGEGAIRRGELKKVFPAEFPEGQGSDFAGIVDTPGAGVTDWKTGDEVIGYTSRQAQAEYIVVPADQLVRKPAGIDWEIAGGLYVAGTTAWASVDAVNIAEGDTVVVSAAGGGVGVWASQLCLRRGATVIGTGSRESFDFLRSIGVTPVEYGDGLAKRIADAAPNGVDAYLDNHGGDNVKTALELGVDPNRINTIVDFEAVKNRGVKSEGNAAGTSTEVLAELAHLVESRAVSVPLSAVYTLDQVREAYDELERGHTRGKIVLGMDPVPHKSPTHKDAPQVG